MLQVTGTDSGWFKQKRDFWKRILGSSQNCREGWRPRLRSLCCQNKFSKSHQGTSWMTPQLLPPNARRGRSYHWPCCHGHCLLLQPSPYCCPSIKFCNFHQSRCGFFSLSASYKLPIQKPLGWGGCIWLVELRSHVHVLAIREVGEEQLTDWLSLMIGGICQLPWLKSDEFYQGNQ